LVFTVTEDKINQAAGAPRGKTPAKVKFQIYGEEIVEKVVKSSGKSGRVYLPLNWVGRLVKIIRMD
jgi:putative transposon-encoded protein